ncbi:methyl-accepting chemotaxis protein [Desulfobacterales bacterium HSG16]|nr:methyl-accepting chemotaxis protein [Desulfobacterales bacterium HSG16]
MADHKGLFGVQGGGGGLISFFTESIRNKLVASLLSLALLLLLLMAGANFVITKKALRENAKDTLEVAQKNKTIAIRKHFADRRSDMEALVETSKALRADAFNRLKSLQQLKKNLIETYFTERLRDVSVMSEMPVSIDALVAFERVSGSIGGPSWREIEQAYGPSMTKFSESFGYYDVYIISENGEILYTVTQESDLGQNLKTGDLKESPAAKAFEKGLSELSFQDFEPYAPADDIPAAFISAPIKVGGSIKGVFMVQVSVDQINYVMQEQTGLGTTGESYLVGADGMFRSDSIQVEESTIVNPAFDVDISKFEEVFAINKGGQSVMINYRGDYVLATWTPVTVHNLTWALVAEVGISEAFIPKHEESEKDFFTNYKEKYGYEDLGLLNPDGFLFYTVNGGADHKTNMLEGPYQDSNLGRLIKEVKETQIFGFADFKPYEPSGHRPAAFFAMPLVNKGEVELIVFTKLSINLLNEVMRAGNEQLGETADSFLVGQDKMWRSDSRFNKEMLAEKDQTKKAEGSENEAARPTTASKEKDSDKKDRTIVLDEYFEVDTTASQQAFEGKAGTGITYSHKGKKVLSTWTPIQIAGSSLEHPDGIKWAVISEVEIKEVDRPLIQMGITVVIVLVIAFGLALLVSLFISRGLTVQVNHINDLFGEIGMGNFAVRAPVTSRDELGIMADSLNAMLDNTLALIQSSEERDSMQQSIMKLLTEISELAEGDLTSRAEVTEDFTGAIADSFNDMAEQLGRVVRNVKDVTIQVSSTSQEVSTSTENLAETSEMQAVQVSDAIAAINEMATSIQQVAENATQCDAVSEESTSHAKEGSEIVRTTNAAMDSIRDHVQETARAIKRLGESSQEVGNIVQLINDIADRTSILALNASIQAAMAGEAGRGFAVVAEEVQRLAERSTDATQQIDTLIKNIQGEINEAGTSMEDSIQQVVEGSKLSDKAYGKLQEIETVTMKLQELIQSISMASKQQARASENIAKTMEEVGEISSQNSAASRQTAVSMKNLAEASDELNESVSVFKLDEDKKNPA